MDPFIFGVVVISAIFNFFTLLIVGASERSRETLERIDLSSGPRTLPDTADPPECQHVYGTWSRPSLKGIQARYCEFCKIVDAREVVVRPGRRPKD